MHDTTGMPRRTHVASRCAFAVRLSIASTTKSTSPASSASLVSAE